jgi:hypothetical protein
MTHNLLRGSLISRKEGIQGLVNVKVVPRQIKGILNPNSINSRTDFHKMDNLRRTGVCIISSH